MMYNRDKKKTEKISFNCKLGPKANWGTGKNHMVASRKHEQERNGTSVLMPTQDKVKIDEYNDGIGTAPQSARNHGPQETDQHNKENEKHELHVTSDGKAIISAGEDVDIPQEESAPRHQNRQLKVNMDNTGIDNGAVNTFARTDATGVSDARTSTEVSGEPGCHISDDRGSRQPLRTRDHLQPVPRLCRKHR
jgi:beta-mannanase